MVNVKLMHHHLQKNVLETTNGQTMIETSFCNAGNKQHLPLSVMSSNTPLKNDVNCCNLVEARGEPRTNGEDLSTTAVTFIKCATLFR